MSVALERPARRESGGLVASVLSTDHKRVGLSIMVVAFWWFLLDGVFALLMRTELARPGLQLMTRDTYNQLFTEHGSGMIYLFVTPLALGLGVYFVPLMVGAAGIAWPRAALAAFWLLIAGGLTMDSGWFTAHGAAKFGWTAFYPLSDANRSPGLGMDLWIVGVSLATLAELVLAACILATILRHRAPGMTMLRLPVFAWSQVATTLMVLMSFPALIVAMALLWWDRHLGGVFDTPGGPAAYQHLFWFYGHPVVYVMFFPFVGIAAEVIAVFSRRRFFGYTAMVLSFLAFAGLSMSVWAHHMFATGQVTNQYFSLTSTALIVPAGVEYFDMIATMVGGAILLRTPMLFAVGFLLQFLIGGLTGIIVASPPLDYHVHDTQFVVAHLHYVLFAGSIFAFFAGVYYWWPKIFGFFLRERLGKLHFALMVVGTNLTFFPLHVLGYEGMARRVADYSPHSGWTDLNELSTLGSYLLAGSVLVFLANVLVSTRRRQPAPADPWQGHTLEWATTSPPPPGNFDSLPEIRSYAPLYDARVRT
ncbi:MAG TPA: cbb3-type cytochrome c oxidase subunit I [Gaiellaceae bacterium]|nr:cbb3-type cytochrome c oxidase subunit I [Gaiellaceae bacterium]